MFSPTTIACASLACALLAAAEPAQSGGQDPCKKSAVQMKLSCNHEALEELWNMRANCSQMPTPAERAQCMIDALIELDEAYQDCRDQFDARRDLCEQLGGGFYAPLIEPANFVPLIDNPFLPLTPGKTFVYEGQTGRGTERVDFMVTHETVEILGVTCTVVHDIASVNGVVEEDTFDWFAQDVLGNVWYFGELSFDHEEGQVVGMEGSWKAGEDFAKPGIVMLAAPQAGRTYRQEFLLGEAEDAATVLSLDAPASVPYGSFPHCLQTADFTPIEPDALEHKFYAPGVGLVLELNVEGGSRMELISVSP
jgi:hypothetical protein